jgi:hypothetical protein
MTTAITAAVIAMPQLSYGDGYYDDYYYGTSNCYILRKRVLTGRGPIAGESGGHGAVMSHLRLS